MPMQPEPVTSSEVPIWRLGPADVLLSPPAGAPQADSVLRRRQLLRGGFWAGVTVLTAGGLAAATDFLAPHDVRLFGDTITVAAKDVPKQGGVPYHHPEGRFWLVNLKPGEGMPEFGGSFIPPSGLGEVSRSGGLLALYDRCTHLGAMVPWRADFEFGGVIGWFRCPTHGATYTKAGLRVFGPAPRAMDTFAIVAVADMGVRINTGAVHLGGVDDAQRTVPAGPFGK